MKCFSLFKNNKNIKEPFEETPCLEQQVMREILCYEKDITTLNIVLCYCGLFKDNGVFIRKMTIDGDDAILIYYKDSEDKDKTVSIPFLVLNSLESLFNNKYIIKLPEKLDDELIGFPPDEYKVNSDKTIKFCKTGQIIGKDNEWRDQDGNIVFQCLRISNKLFDISLFNQVFVVTKSLKEYINRDFKSEEQCRFEEELIKSKEQANKQNCISILAIFAAFLTPLIASKCSTSNVKMSDPIIIEQKLSPIENELQEIKTSIDVISEDIMTNSQEIDSLSKTIKGLNRNKHVK